MLLLFLAFSFYDGRDLPRTDSEYRTPFYSMNPPLSVFVAFVFA